MDIGQTPRSVLYQPVPVPVPDLRIQAVAPVNEAAKARTEGRSRSDRESRDGQPQIAATPPSVGDVVDRSITLDPETRSFVFQALNARGEVVLQYPDQALLRGRAYARQISSEEQASARLDEKA